MDLMNDLVAAGRATCLTENSTTAFKWWSHQWLRGCKISGCRYFLKRVLVFWCIQCIFWNWNQSNHTAYPLLESVFFLLHLLTCWETYFWYINLVNITSWKIRPAYCIPGCCAKLISLAETERFPHMAALGHLLQVWTSSSQAGLVSVQRRRWLMRDISPLLPLRYASRRTFLVCGGVSPGEPLTVPAVSQ